jgi:hypothetical protein
VAARRFSPPLLTKSWFHLGPIADEFVERSETDLSGSAVKKVSERWVR